MRKSLFGLMAALALAACATGGSLALDADKGFFAAQAAFKSYQQAALAMITSGALTGAAKEKAIAINDAGVQAEATGYAAIQAADLVAETNATSDLGNFAGQLAALGVQPATSTTGN